MKDAIPVSITIDSDTIPDILDLVQRTFAYMEPRINPPSSMYRMTVASIKEHCAAGEIWAIGNPPHACVFLKEKADCLYLGKLAVSERMRGKGVARQLIQLAENRAREKRLSTLELETRIELRENHETFRRLGFVKVGEGRHEGFSEPTYIVMRKPL